MCYDLPDLADVIRDLHCSAQRFADTVLKGAALDEVTAIRIGSSTTDNRMSGIDAWPAAANPGFGIFMRFPDEKWYELMSPGMIFRDAVLQHLLGERGILLGEDGPIAGSFVTELGGVETTWDVSAESKDAEITLTRRTATSTA